MKTFRKYKIAMTPLLAWKKKKKKVARNWKSPIGRWKASNPSPPIIHTLHRWQRPQITFSNFKNGELFKHNIFTWKTRKSLHFFKPKKQTRAFCLSFSSSLEIIWLGNCKAKLSFALANVNWPSPVRCLLRKTVSNALSHSAILVYWSTLHALLALCFPRKYYTKISVILLSFSAPQISRVSIWTSLWW